MTRLLRREFDLGVKHSSPASYEDFRWDTAGPANGESGLGLAESFIRIISSLQVKRICDLGCGNGYLAGRLAELGYDLVGVDASATGIAIAQQNHSKPRFVNALIDAGLSERTGLGDFDLVISSDVIEHLYRPEDLLECALSLLKSKGQILVSTPYHGYWKNLALGITGRLDNHFTVHAVGGHIKFFSVRTLSTLMRSVGFEDLKFNFYGRAPWLWKSMICHAQRGEETGAR
jgi:2-polyprenyl-3-methyl-5-hydroxy-6-metoxy-1,4-benzoquinol methylase